MVTVRPPTAIKTPPPAFGPWACSGRAPAVLRPRLTPQPIRRGSAVHKRLPLAAATLIPQGEKESPGGSLAPQSLSHNWL